MTADEIRAYFKAKGVSQQEVARFIDVDSRTVRRWFAGEKPPHLFELAIKADIFKTYQDHESRITTKLILRKNK